MTTLKYQDRVLDVLTKEELIASLLYSEGYDAKNKVNIGNKLDFATIGASQVRDFVTEFYAKNGEAPDMIIVDLGNEHYLPTYFSSWKIEQYRDLDGSPYLGLKQPKIEHFIYFFPEQITTAAVPESWAATEVSVASPKKEYDFDNYDSWNINLEDYSGRYDDGSDDLDEPEDTLDFD